MGTVELRSSLRIELWKLCGLYTWKAISKLENMAMKPKSVSRPKQWTEEVEEAWRFQVAGYRDENEYKEVKKSKADRWDHNGYVKKLQRKDGCYIYFDRTRECLDKDLIKTKIYCYWKMLLAPTNILTVEEGWSCS